MTPIGNRQSPIGNLSAINADNPWPGLATFTEDQGAYFHGRDDEIDDLTQLARLRALVVLFGQSGLGKSSLLQAGVFPRLRAAGFCPIYIRLDHAESAPSPTEQIKSLLLSETAKVGTWTKPGAAKPGETLWELFHHRDDRLIGPGGRAIIPVLVFDQFEELFTLGAAAGGRRERAVAFMSELAELVENRPSEQLVARLEASADELETFDFSRADYRVVITLREDFLPELEGLKTIMPAMMANRMRLARMTGTQALQAVVKPGAAVVTEEVACKIVEFVAGARGGSIERLAELNVEPALLSVVCRELNERRKALGHAQITADLVTGNRREILTDFYERSVNDLPAGMRTFVEDRLLTKSGFRDNIALETALEEPGVTRPLIDTLVARRLLRLEDRAGIQRVEITHDVLAEVIRASRDTRQQRIALEQAQERERLALEAAEKQRQHDLALAARQTRRQRWIIGGLAAVVVALGTAGLYGLRLRRLDLQRNSRADFTSASRQLEEGRTTEGIALLLRAARRDPHNPAIAPRLASLLTSRNFLLPEGAAVTHPAPVVWTDFSVDGKRAGVLWQDGTHASIDLASGAVERARLPSPPQPRVRVFKLRSYVVVPCEDGVTRILDRAGRLVRELPFERPGTGRQAVAPARGRPESDYFIAGRDDTSAFVADAATGRMLPPLPSAGGFFSNPSHGWVIWRAPRSTGPNITEIRLRDLATGTTELTLQVPHGLFGHSLSPTGRQLAVVQRVSDNSAFYLRLYTLPDLAPLGPALPIGDMTGDQILGTDTAYSPDGRFIVTLSPAALDVWDAQIGAHVTTIKPTWELGTSAMLLPSPDNRTLAILTILGRLELWDLRTGERRGPPQQHGGRVRYAEFSDDGRTLMTTASDGLVRVWDATNSQLLAEPTLQQRASPVAALSPDGTQLTIGTREGALYRLRIGQGRSQPLALPRTQLIEPAMFLPGTPSRLLEMLGDRARVLDAATGREVPGGFSYPEPLRRTRGRGSDRSVFERKDLRVLMVRTASDAWQAWWLGEGKVEKVVPVQDPPPRAPLHFASFSRTGDRVVLTWPGHVRAWDLHTGQPVGPAIATAFGPGTGLAPGINLNPDGTRVTVGANNGEGRVWDTVTGKEVLTFESPATRVDVLLYSPDGRRIATGNNLGELQLWDGRNGEPASPVLLHSPDIAQAEFSSDGKLLSRSSDGVLRIWEGSTGTPLGEPISLELEGIRSAHFSADGRRIVTTARDGPVRLWDVRSGLAATEPLAVDQTQTYAEFSPDGRFVRNDTQGNVYHLWAVPPPLPAGGKTPEWLLDLAAICAGVTLNEDGQIAAATDAFGKIADVRRTLAALPDNAPYVEWGRWFLSDRATRSVAPGFKITAAEAEKMAKESAATASPPTPAPARTPRRKQ